MSSEGKVIFYDVKNEFGKITPSVEGVGFYKFRKSGLNTYGDAKLLQKGVVVTYDIGQGPTNAGNAINVSLKVLRSLTDSDYKRIGVEAILKVQKLSADDHKAEDIERVRTRVEKAIRNGGPYRSAKVHIFGSWGQGLPARDSDADFSVDLQGDGTWATPGVPLEAVEELKEVLADSFGAFFDKATSAEVLKVIKARVPIVNFNAKQGIKWDLSVEPSGVLSSVWLRIFFADDPNLRVAAMWLKNWFKEEELIDSHNGLSSYAVIMLVVYYAVKNGQAKDWDPAAVDMSKAAVWPEFLGRAGDGDGVDAEKVGKLIGGFFDFFRLFNFTQNVVTLKAHPSTVTTKVHLRWTKDVCIQDAFNKDDELAGRLKPQKAMELLAAFYRGASELRQ